MTFTEAALEILKREGKPLHFKELTERAMTKKLLTFVGRTPEVTMQTQLTAAVKKAPGNPFVRVKPGIFGLLRYPELTAEERAAEAAEVAPKAQGASARPPASTDEKKDDKRRDRPEKRATEESTTDERGRRRRRRGGRGRGGAKEGDDVASAAAPRASHGESESAARRTAREATERPSEEADDDGPSPVGGLSPEARAAALAETGVLEGDDDEMMSADEEGDQGGDFADQQDNAESGAKPARPAARSAADSGTAVEGGAGGPAIDDDDDNDGAFGSPSGGAGDGDGEGGAEGEGEALKAGDSDDPARRRRRRRRRRRGAEGEFGGAEPGAPGAGPVGQSRSAAADTMDSPRSRDANGDGGGGERSTTSSDGTGDLSTGNVGGGESGVSSDGTAGGPQGARKIMAPVDAAIEILRGQPPGRGVHVRQIADSAIRRRLIHGEPNEAWRVIRTSLAAEPKDRLRSGMRPRVRSAGSGLYALARRPPDAELEKAEQVFGEARRALRERTIAALEKRITELPSGAFEALARVLLQREGFGPTTFVKRVEGTIYVEALRGRGSRPSKCLIALRPGGSAAGRRAIGELRAGIRARGQDEGLLMLGGRLAEDAISEWKQAGCPLEIADGAALAETCARHGVGVLSATVNVDFVDADFFAELAEG
ncbi:MAG: HTH domain-containing protein [Polyangia bacterium]